MEEVDPNKVIRENTVKLNKTPLIAPPPVKKQQQVPPTILESSSKVFVDDEVADDLDREVVVIEMA